MLAHFLHFALWYKAGYLAAKRNFGHDRGNFGSSCKTIVIELLISLPNRVWDRCDFSVNLRKFTLL